jgi:signal transduction histidine kinase/ActR/RegA family two-component response regulator
VATRRGLTNDNIVLLRWLARSAETGAAVLREGRISCTTGRLRTLCRQPGEWRWIAGPHAHTRYPDLRAVIVDETSALLQTDARTRTSRFDTPNCALDLRLERLRTARGEAVIVVAHDVTGQVREELERLRDRETRLHEQRMHAMGVVASGVAHDLNHALNVIALRIARLRADPGLRSQIQSLESIARRVEEAAGTVARLQDLARRRRDRPSEAVDLSAVLLGSVEMARTDFDRPGPRVEIHADVPPLPLVRATAAELSHLFSDLLLNAKDSMPGGGTIEVRAREGRSGVVVVTVKDEGRGIPEQELPRVFDPFFSTSETRETGLALSIAYGLMQRLGGSISAANRAGGGSVFTLEFPLASRSARRNAEERSSSGRRLRVLLVDDEPDNIEILQELLTLDGHEAETATSGRAALDLFAAGHRYDLVLCDVGMPEMSGWQVVRELHEIDPGLPIYLLTGWANEIGEHDPRLRPVRGVLGKPLDLDELRSVLTSAGRPPSGHGREHASMAS